MLPLAKAFVQLTAFGGSKHFALETNLSTLRSLAFNCLVVVGLPTFAQADDTNCNVEDFAFWHDATPATLQACFENDETRQAALAYLRSPSQFATDGKSNYCGLEDRLLAYMMEEDTFVFRGSNRKASEILQCNFYSISMETVRRFHELGADFSLRSNLGFDLYAQALSDADLWEEKIRFLSEIGAPPNRRSNSGQSALHYALQIRSGPRVVAALLDVGFTPNTRDQHGWTALHTLARFWYGESFGSPLESVAKMLLEGGVDLNAQDARGETAIHTAARIGDSYGAILPLLALGADGSIQNNDGFTAFDLAKQRGLTPDQDSELYWALSDTQFE